MKKHLKNHWLTLTGAALGLVGGFLYWRFAGCTTGGCPITSSPWLSALWGALIGGLLLSMFRKDNKTAKKPEL